MGPCEPPESVFYTSGSPALGTRYAVGRTRRLGRPRDGPADPRLRTAPAGRRPGPAVGPRREPAGRPRIPRDRVPARQPVRPAPGRPRPPAGAPGRPAPGHQPAAT